MERIYTIPLRKEFQKAPSYKRSSKAIRAIKKHRYQIEKVGTVEDTNLYGEAKAFSTAAVRGEVEAKPVAELEVAKEAPTTNLKDDDIPF